MSCPQGRLLPSRHDDVCVCLCHPGMNSPCPFGCERRSARESLTAGRFPRLRARLLVACGWDSIGCDRNLVACGHDLIGASRDLIDQRGQPDQQVGSELLLGCRQ